ncbi:inositol-pentakisphosphate 2-kinase [Tupaia chinensis]|uniref:inositol-pentakisphosphate 2-kinase n=1 Tax=Tupaia chinensis TaxID=246437 RepID=UPI000FFC94EF|nr:inositol-pentakisphosphate 2-kinase [Tupaia chinensis]
MDEGKMDENEWRYHGEGNKSLVVAHAQRCVVLRFLKFPPNRKKTSEEIFQHLQNIVDFGKNVMREFLGENYVHCGEVVQLPLEFVKQLCVKIQSERPESRCDKDLDTLSGYAMCLPNLTRLQTYRVAEHRPTLCVEIKPKCGFIPFSSDVTHEMKHKVCRYCMHQHLKVKSRCDKDLDTLSGYAMCLPNLTRLQTYRVAEHRPTLCVEIKPKCGFIPFSSDVTHEMKHKVCRYCMHQHLKVATGKWKQISQYCPLDLYSGNKQRMHFALKSLLQEAQNNLKIFKNGELIYGCRDARSPAADWGELAHHLKPFFFPSNGLASGPHCTRAVIRELVRVITRVLLSGSDKGRPGALRPGPVPRGPRVCEAQNEWRSGTSVVCVHTGPGSSAGGRAIHPQHWGPSLAWAELMAEPQRTPALGQPRLPALSSASDNELLSFSPMFLVGKNAPERSGLPKGCLLYKTLQVQMLDLLDIEGLYPLYNRVERYLEESPEERKMLQIDGPYDEAFYQQLLDLSTEDDGTVAFALRKVQQYRVAMTAKDCSIMIALAPCLQDASSDQRPVVPSSRSRFAFSVSVLDLDLKPYESIPHQYKLDGKIVSYYSKAVRAKDAAVVAARFKESEDCTLVLHKV